MPLSRAAVDADHCVATASPTARSPSRAKAARPRIYCLRLRRLRIFVDAQATTMAATFAPRPLQPSIWKKDRPRLVSPTLSRTRQRAASPPYRRPVVPSTSRLRPLARTDPLGLRPESLSQIATVPVHEHQERFPDGSVLHGVTVS